MCKNNDITQENLREKGSDRPIYPILINWITFWDVIKRKVVYEDQRTPFLIITQLKSSKKGLERWENMLTL